MWMDESVNGWMDELVNIWMDEWVNGWKIEWINECMEWYRNDNTGPWFIFIITISSYQIIGAVSINLTSRSPSNSKLYAYECP